MEFAAIVAAVLLAIVAAVQVALVFGAPWGEHVYGGRAETDNGRLSSRYERERTGYSSKLECLLFSCLSLSGPCQLPALAREASERTPGAATLAVSWIGTLLVAI